MGFKDYFKKHKIAATNTAFLLAFYAGFVFILPRVFDRKRVNIEPGKSYNIFLSGTDSSWNPFSINKTYYSAQKSFDGENVAGYEYAEMKRGDVSQKFEDDNLDGIVDAIDFEEDGISVKLKREKCFETYQDEFAFGDSYLRQTRERFNDTISEVEKKACFFK